MVPLELQAGHPASRYRLSRAQCPSLASSRFALNTSITRRTDILDPHTLAEATRFGLAGPLGCWGDERFSLTLGD